MNLTTGGLRAATRNGCAFVRCQPDFPEPISRRACCAGSGTRP